MIANITSPLSLFALIISVIEGLLGVFAARANGTDFTVLAYGMVGALILLIIVFAGLMLARGTSLLDTVGPSNEPQVMGASFGAPYVITLAPPDDMHGFDLTRITWNRERCLARCSDQEVKVKPAFGAGAAFEVRLPPAIVKVASDSEPVELDLSDDKGNEWRVRPFFLSHRTVSLTYVTGRERIVETYGSGR